MRTKRNVMLCFKPGEYKRIDADISLDSLYFFLIRLTVDTNLHNPLRLAFAVCGLCMYLFFVT